MRLLVAPEKSAPPIGIEDQQIGAGPVRWVLNADEPWMSALQHEPPHRRSVATKLARPFQAIQRVRPHADACRAGGYQRTRSDAVEFGGFRGAVQDEKTDPPSLRDGWC